ncbi:sulfite exporter TauE/SafE family protein [Sphingobacteriales bacterium UPWRP_1]|nr:hypothetical protein BVG80_13475 [Sphingobacteriales bacterium TSM_CSM]PSJ74403.1 sulfite exporter TauE/SafE family protein [Sphingobacteriales bacterium UPWRP_1]
MYLWTAFTLGLLGSFHCVGMCGPIALALPYRGNSYWVSALNVLLYNVGRAITYSLLGALLGLAGKGVALSGYQQALSVAIGVLLLLMALLSVNFESRVQQIGVVKHFTGRVKKMLAKLLQSNGSLTMLGIGILNGFLPCGFVYLGLAGALTTSGILHGALFMALFGLGTIPAMMSVSLLGNVISLNLRKKIQQALPVLLVFFAALFILRGLNLGIPYLSPHMGKTTTEKVRCH